MPDDLARLREIAEAATPGPWSQDDGNIWCPHHKVAQTTSHPTPPTALAVADAKFIATFDPPTVLALLDRLARTEAEHQAEVAALKAERDEWECKAERAAAVIGADDRLDNWDRLLERAERAEAERDAALAEVAEARRGALRIIEDRIAAQLGEET